MRRSSCLRRNLFPETKSFYLLLEASININILLLLLVIIIFIQILLPATGGKHHIQNWLIFWVFLLHKCHIFSCLVHLGKKCQTKLSSSSEWHDAQFSWVSFFLVFKESTNLPSRIHRFFKLICLYFIFIKIRIHRGVWRSLGVWKCRCQWVNADGGVDPCHKGNSGEILHALKWQWKCRRCWRKS